MNEFKILGKLPSLNDVIDANRTNRYAGAKMKKDIERRILIFICAARVSKKLKPVNTSCIIFIEWHEATKRRDADNIQSAQKFILDALKKGGILPDDGRKYVKQIYHEIVDDKEDYVIVKIERIEQNETK